MKDIDNLASLYTEGIQTTTNVVPLTEETQQSDDSTLNENVEVGTLKPEVTDVLGNNPLAQPVKKFQETGPNAVALQAPVETQDDEANAIHSKPVSQKKQKKEENLEKTMQEGINIETMSKEKNIFDKLYAVIMEDDRDLDDIDLDFEDELESSDDEGGHDEVTLSLPRDIAQQLCDSLKAQLDDGDSDLEDLDDLDDLEDLDDLDSEDVFPENVETGEVKTNAKPEPAPDGSTKAGNKAEWNVKNTGKMPGDH